MGLEAFPKDVARKYELHEWNHPVAVLIKDFPKEWEDLVAVLKEFVLKRSWVEAPGGGKSKISQSLDEKFHARGWVEKGFDTKIVVDDKERESPTHKVDCYKNGVALEVEWNNKDPFFDRDLNNFRLLFELRVISVGIIITRCDELQEIFEEVGKEYGGASTHMSKLIPKIEGGGGGGCPILVVGIAKNCYSGTE